MYCPKCGKENPDDAQVCRSCSWVLTSTPAQAPGLGVKTSGLAIAALVLGILSFFTCGITAIPAIILGIISLVKIEKSGGRITGRGFAIGGIVVPVVALPVLLSMMILMPALKRVREQARSVACQSNLKQWSLIFSMYTEENNGYFISGEGRDNGRWWIEPVRPYYRNINKLLLCPGAVAPYTEGGRNPFGGWKVDNYVGSYGLNGWICNPKESATSLWRREPIENYWRTPNVQGANNIPVFLDAMWVNAWPKSTDQPPEWENWQEDEVRDNEIRCFCINRHTGFVNGLFMDWSVRKVGLKELWTLNWHRGCDTNGPWTRAGHVQPSDWPPWMRNFRDY
jgi:hypothetical protein